MRGGGGLAEFALHGLYMVCFAVVGKFAERLLVLAERYYDIALDWWRPRVEITVPLLCKQWYDYNPLFTAVDTYLCSSASKRVRRLKAEADESRNVTYALDRGEHVVDVFDGERGGCFEVRWDYFTERTNRGRGSEIERRYYTLSFEPQHRAEVVGRYLRHVMETSRQIEARLCPKKLYSNSMGQEDEDERLWKSLPFKHPGTFATLAMDPKKKQTILDDLTAFSKSGDYYASIGKAWKRGYLLYGPPGTGKSTMVAAIANFLDYDVYDLELTAVASNGELRQLMISTHSRSVIVIEDIDCSLDLSGARRDNKEKKKKQKKDADCGGDDGGAASWGESADDGEGAEDSDVEKPRNKKKKNRKVTLSGLLNSIDGLWSVCGGERIIVLTSNHPDKLDPALLRRGRMDMHIELSYCCFEAFKVLAKNYLGLDDHPLFADVRRLLEETKIAPADVAEHLMPKIAPLATAEGHQTQQIRVKNIHPEVKTECLRDLVRALQEAKDSKKKKKKKSGESEEKGRKGQAMGWPPWLRRRRKAA